MKCFSILLSTVFWSSVAQIRGIGIKIFAVRILDGFAKLFSDIFEKTGSKILSIFIGAICLGYLLGILIGNPLVCLMLAILIFLSVCAKGTGLLLLVLYLAWSDLQRLLKVKKKRAFYIDIVSMALRGVLLGLSVYSIVPFISYGDIIQYIILLAFIVLLILNIIKKTNPSVASFIFLLAGSLIIMHSKVLADDGGWKESGGSFWDWLNSEGSWEAFKKGLEPALWAASLGIGFIPVIGDIKDAQEALIGIDLLTGEKLSVEARLLTAAAMFIPVVSGKMLRASGEVAEFALKHGDEVVEFAGKHGDEVADLVGDVGKIRKTDRLKKHILNGELDAARRESMGEVVARKADGTHWNHVKELQDAQNGLLKRISKINQELNKPDLDIAVRTALNKELSDASKLLDKTEEFLPR